MRSMQWKVDFWAPTENLLWDREKMQKTGRICLKYRDREREREQNSRVRE
jgi:hypothetical protein